MNLLANRLLAAGGVILDVRTLTDGQFLRRTGDTIDSAAGGGGITTIASGSIAAATVQDITSIPATYAYIVLQVNGLSSNTASRLPLVQVDSDNGASFDTTASNYLKIYKGAGGAVTDGADASLLPTSAAAAAAETFTFSVVLFGYQGGPNMSFTSHLRRSGGINYLAWGSYIGGTTAINALRVLWNGTGDSDAGTYALYGCQ